MITNKLFTKLDCLLTNYFNKNIKYFFNCYLIQYINQINVDYLSVSVYLKIKLFTYKLLFNKIISPS